jgi:hypothetical protein
MARNVSMMDINILKGGNKMSLIPHSDVYCRLGASKIHGVGVFAIIDIPANTDPFKHCQTEYKKYKVSELFKDIKPEHKKLYDDFCVFEGGDKYVWTPKSFNRIDISYYLNSSKKPNMRADEHGDFFFTTRLIKSGEELTVDYDTYSDH